MSSVLYMKTKQCIYICTCTCMFSVTHVVYMFVSQRQGSGPYSSEEISRSGEGIIGHPEPSDIEVQGVTCNHVYVLCACTCMYMHV